MSAEFGGAVCRRVFAFIFIILAVLASQGVFAETEEQSVRISIPPSDAGTALNEFAKQAEIQILFDFELAQSVQANEVSGRYTAWRALQLVVENTGLTAVRIDDGTYSVVSDDNNGEDSELDNIRIDNEASLAADSSGESTMLSRASLSESFDSNPPLDEITVTGRKREESLQNIPMNIEVLSSTLLDDAGVIDIYDFFAMVPGVDMEDPNGDRNGANPAIRGVQAGGNGANVVTRRANSFLDGMPLTGQQGTINFIDSQAIEVYSGPQSAAFGRATFTGAINYVSKDPTEEFEGNIQLTTSTFDRNQATIALSGPLTESLGFTLDAQKSDYDGPREWSTSDGFGVGGTSTDYVSGKLDWTPNDFFNLEVRALHGKTDDESSTRHTVNASELNCKNLEALQNGRVYFVGAVDCDFDDSFVIPTNYNVTVPDQAYVDYADGLISGEELAGFEAVAAAYSIPDGPVVTNERDRISAELSFAFEESTLEVLAFAQKEDSLVWVDADRSDTPLVYTSPSSGDVAMAANLAAPMSMAIPGGLNHMANPNSIEEEYLEVRWLSPDDQKWRWLVGASYYKYDYNQLNYSQYNAILNPELQEFSAVGRVVPTQVINEQGENSGLFFNLTWDLTKETTLSFEGRYQDDDVTNANILAANELAAVAAGELDSTFATRGSITSNSKSFQPRIAVNHVLSDEVSVYAQVAVGYNPGGANPEWLEPATIEAMQLLLAQIETVRDSDPDNDALAPNGELTQQELNNFINSITFDETTLLSFDEERMINYEVGIKATSEDGRFGFTSALYRQQWDDIVSGAIVDFDAYDFLVDTNAFIDSADYSPAARGNGGSADLTGLDTTVTYRPNRNWKFRGTLSLHQNTYAEFCDPDAAALGFENDRFASSGEVVQDCVSIDGNELSRTPEVTSSLSLTYRNTLFASGWDYAVRGDIRYTGKQWLDTANLMELPATTLYNLNLVFTAENWNVALYGNNLTNEKTPRTVIAENVTNVRDLDLTITPQIPREYGLRVRYSF